MNSSLLLIFTRNPELGKVKTRLAAAVGDQTALDIYTFLLDHTVSITKDLPVTKRVFYTEKVQEDDIWATKYFEKRLQTGTDLGERMKSAFAQGFKEGFKKIVVIGSDMYDLSSSEILEAFDKLETHDYVIGPATDGGYYLLGMQDLKDDIFENKAWGTSSVLKETLADIQDESLAKLAAKNDVDTIDDIRNHKAFQQFLIDIT